MKRRCGHVWKTVGTSYAPPTGGKGDRLTEWQVNVMQLGATTVSLRCTICGEVDARHFAGRYIDPTLAVVSSAKPSPDVDGR